MRVGTCGIIVPRRNDPAFRLGSENGDCLRYEFHTDGKHLFRNDRGEYILWEDDYSCGCCAPDEADRCTVFGFITEEEARELLARRD